MLKEYVSKIASHDPLADTFERLGAPLGSTFVGGNNHLLFIFYQSNKQLI
jgi:hypothetical protein